MFDRAARFLTGCMPARFLGYTALLPGFEAVSSMADRLAAALVCLTSSKHLPDMELQERGRNRLALSTPPVILNLSTGVCRTGIGAPMDYGKLHMTWLGASQPLS